jgi:DNA-binding transcriptional LysR family regulator
MTLKQLEAFYWAATCANFAVAAQRLHLSVSSLSKRITELEESLKRPLFDRSGHKAILTDAGQQLLPKARELLESAAAVRDVFTGSEGLSGRCSFGVGELSALTWLPRFIAQARKAYPRLALEAYVDVGAALEQKVDKGELDFAVIASRSSRQTILSQPLTHAHFVWMASPALAGRAKGMSAALLASNPLISLPPGAGTTRIIDGWLLNQGITTEERIFCNNWGAIAGMLIEGVGVGILPEGSAANLVKRKQLRVMKGDPDLAPLAYSFQWRRDDMRPVIAAMRDLTKRIADFSMSSNLL